MQTGGGLRRDAKCPTHQQNRKRKRFYCPAWKKGGRKRRPFLSFPSSPPHSTVAFLWDAPLCFSWSERLSCPMSATNDDDELNSQRIYGEKKTRERENNKGGEGDISGQVGKRIMEDKSGRRRGETGAIVVRSNRRWSREGGGGGRASMSTRP